MKKLIWSVFTLLIFSLVLPAQEDLTPVAYSVSGKVKYAPGPDAPFEKLRGGRVLSPEGRVKIYPDAALGIYYDKEYALVNTAGEQSVAAITNNVDLFQESDLAELFGKSVQEAVNPYFQVRSGFAAAGDPPPPPPSKKEIDGAGNKEFKIIRIQPSGGTVGQEKIQFRWKMATPGVKVKKFIFTLRSDTDEILFEKTVKGYKFELTPDDYRLQHKKTYRWQVAAEDNPGLNTPEITFSYAQPIARAQIKNDLAKTDMYSNANSTTKMLLEAAVLEQANFLSGAYNLYRTAVKKNKKDQLAQLLLQAFEWRYDMIE